MRKFAGLVVLLAIACGDDDAATSDAGARDASVGLPWGPSFVGVQESDDDIALGVFWDPDQIAMEYSDDDCFVVHTRKDTVVGRDVGELRVTGGSTVSSQALTRNDAGYYYLSDVADAWSEGDEVSLESDDYGAGPAKIPSALVDESLSTLTSVSRAEPLVLEASGSDGKLIGASLSGSTETDSYLVICTTDASAGKLVIAGDALATLPAEITSLHVKLQGANAADGGDFRLLAAGRAIEADVTLQP